MEVLLHDERCHGWVTFSEGDDCCPVWTPDGEHVLFSSTRDGPLNIYRKAASGAGAVERVTTSQAAQTPYATTDDGRTLIYVEGEDLYSLSLDGAQEAKALLTTDAREERPTLSPDGRWIAYESNESGTREVYVRSFPDLEGGGSWKISSGGGDEPLWSPTGRELFYRTSTSFMKVDVETETTFSHGQPEVLFADRYNGGAHRKFAVSADGGRFLVDEVSFQMPGELVLVQNWHQELLERVPIP